MFWQRMCRFFHRIQPCQGHNCKYQILTCMRHDQKFTNCPHRYCCRFQAQWLWQQDSVGICHGLVKGWYVRTSFCMRRPWSYRSRKLSAHARLTWKSRSARGLHVKLLADKGQVSGEPQFWLHSNILSRICVARPPLTGYPQRCLSIPQVMPKI